jgi:hypothetical protein
MTMLRGITLASNTNEQKRKMENGEGATCQYDKSKSLKSMNFDMQTDNVTSSLVDIS